MPSLLALDTTLTRSRRKDFKSEVLFLLSIRLWRAQPSPAQHKPASPAGFFSIATAACIAFLIVFIQGRLCFATGVLDVLFAAFVFQHCHRWRYATGVVGRLHPTVHAVTQFQFLAPHTHALPSSAACTHAQL